MDIISHGIVGAMAGSAHKPEKRDITFATLFSILPDISLIVPYFVLGFIKNRFLWIPSDLSWDAFRVAHSGLTILWDISHSIFFLLFIIVPLVLIFKWPRITIFAYLLHIIIDTFTHSGDWILSPFYPLKIVISGPINAWILPWWGLMGTWIFLLAVFLVVGSASFLAEKIRKFAKQGRQDENY